MEHTNKKRISPVAVLCTVLICAGLAAILCIGHCGRTSNGTGEDTTEPVADTEPGQPFSEMMLGDGIAVTRLFSYTGVYMEDGSDTPVIGVAACTVENRGTDAVQLMSFSLRNADGEVYRFTVTSLLPGQRVNVPERGRMPYDETDVGFTAVREQYVAFGDKPSLHPDKVQILCIGGTLQLTNLTDNTMSTCRVCYKYKQDGTYIGGITFSVKVTDLKPGEPATLTPSHYHEDTCEILYVTYE